jgi:hypothetical protein
VRTKWSLTLFLRSLRGRLTLLHDLVDRERLAEKSLSLGRLDRSASDLRIAGHDDGKALGLAAGGVRDKHSILDRHEGREQLAHLLDLHPRVKIADVDLEHWHGRNSRLKDTE